MPDDVDLLLERARVLFLDRSLTHGCAETTYLVLCEAFGVGDPADSSPAMALNGGVAYSGGPCGAITGAALAIGLLAGRRIEDHRTAKRVARELTMRLMDGFLVEHGAVGCRDLIGIDLRAPGGHVAYIRSGAWQGACMRQVETAIRAAAPLADEEAWEAAVRDILAAG
ncbi:MAG: C-GCAxxG-C-C family protein [Chloroflexi bacterium]|jgi:C_GCAxxG_C_C family probable redox protein|nr:C-GCAxxG-C-C family protein [Chloroflexota bacterium]